MIHLTLIALENAVANLQQDLKPLEQQMRASKEGMFITHNNADILVYARSSYKAYIPKKYDGFTVKFVVCNGEDLHLHVNSSIYAVY